MRTRRMVGKAEANCVAFNAIPFLISTGAMALDCPYDHSTRLVLALDDNGGSSTATVADSGATVLAGLESVCKRDNNAGT